jgi:rhodanese-related sulfurtransferase
MEDIPYTPPVDLNPDELKKFINSHKESQYLLIDVRQPGEYQLGHLPGAKLMPLMELESKLFSLPADQDLVFYCRSGGRSLTAASLAQEAEVTEGRVYNLSGGIMGWYGKTLSAFPKVQLFDKASALDDLLYIAMDLEKGAWRYYQFIVNTFSAEPYIETFNTLSKAETAHAKTIYSIRKGDRIHPEPFKAVFDRLDGEILEGGQSLDDVLKQLDTLDGDTCMNLIELSLHIEYSAFDLYRTMADRTEEPDARKAFLSIAQAEKAHMRALTRAIEHCQM